MTAEEVAIAREMLSSKLWRERPRDGSDRLSVRLTIDGENVGSVTIAAGWIKERREYGWTRINQLRAALHTEEGFIDGDADIEPILDRITRAAHAELRIHEATRRLIVDLIDAQPQPQRAKHGAIEDTPEAAARIFALATEQGRRDPIVWVAAILDISERTAHRRLDDAAEQGLIERTRRQPIKKRRGARQ